MKTMRYLFAFLILSVFSVSCELLSGDNGTNDENHEQQGHEDGPEDKHFGCVLEFPAEGVTDENFLAFCINLTHEYKYEFQGLDNCSWVRICNIQNVDGHDWMPYITVDPNATGSQRSVEVVAIYDQSVCCRHTIVQKPGDIRKRCMPKVCIETPDAAEIVSKETWISDAVIKVYDEYGDLDLSTQTDIRGRGNSTWGYPKKPYALKLNSKEQVLGMPKHKRWVLLANWMDRTLLRNDVAFELGRRTMAWAPRGRFVELYMNGVHKGNYYLCEHIKVDSGRVDIAELDEDSDFSDAGQVTGGYILEFDVYGPNDEINYFYSNVKKYPVAIKEPDEDVITSWSHPGYLYIKEYIGEVERVLEEDKSARSRWKEIESLIDVTSYIDWWLVHEVCKNGEPGHPKSSYMYKDRNGKLYAGPLWDFDWGTFMPGVNGAIIARTLWYGYLFEYPEFKAAVKTRWGEVKSVYESVGAYIDVQAAALRESNEVNINMWPITRVVNGDESMSYDQAITRMKDAFNHRISSIDTYIRTL